MRSTSKPYLVAALVAAFAPAACKSSGARPQALDGRTYFVTLEAQGQSSTPDRLIFDGGRFESTACTSAGFERSAYATRLVAGGVAFDVQCGSPTMGHNDWHGVAAGDHVEGTVIRTPKDGGAPIKMTFAGDIVR